MIEFELDGSDVALQDAIRGLTTALTERGRAGTTSPVRRITSGNGTGAPAVDPVDADVPDADAEEVADETEAPRGTTPRGTGKPRAVARPKVIELDLTSGDMPLQTFIEQENPEADSRRYLRIAYWFKHHRQLESVGMNHIYTAYRALGWNNMPADPLLPFRNMKNKGLFDNGTTRGEYRLNHVGEGKIGNNKK